MVILTFVTLDIALVSKLFAIESPTNKTFDGDLVDELDFEPEGVGVGVDALCSDDTDGST